MLLVFTSLKNKSFQDCEWIITGAHCFFALLATTGVWRGLVISNKIHTEMGPLQLGSRDHNFPKNRLYYGL